MVPIASDTNARTPEFFEVVLESPEGGAGLGAFGADVEIAGASYPAGDLTIRAGTPSVNEGSEASFWVSRNFYGQGAVSVTVRVAAGGSATPGQDFRNPGSAGLAGRRADVGGRRNGGEIPAGADRRRRGRRTSGGLHTGTRVANRRRRARRRDTGDRADQCPTDHRRRSRHLRRRRAVAVAVPLAGSARCCSGWAARCVVDGFGTASVLVRLKWADGLPICPSRRSRLLRQVCPDVRRRSRCGRRDSRCAAFLLSRRWRRRSRHAGGRPRAGAWRSALRLPDVPGRRESRPRRLPQVRHGARARRAGGNGRRRSGTGRHAAAVRMGGRIHRAAAGAGDGRHARWRCRVR